MSKSVRTFAAAAMALLLTAGIVAAAPEKVQNSVGVVKEYSASAHAFSVEDESGRTIRFLWARETKFNGVVSIGARVTVRYTEQADGKNLAQTVGVLK